MRQSIYRGHSSGGGGSHFRFLFAARVQEYIVGHSDRVLWIYIYTASKQLNFYRNLKFKLDELIRFKSIFTRIWILDITSRRFSSIEQGLNEEIKLRVTFSTSCNASFSNLHIYVKFEREKKEKVTEWTYMYTSDLCLNSSSFFFSLIIIRLKI